MMKLKLKWFGLLIASTLVLIWRLMDFADEAASEGFHMTRGGLAIWGSDAEFIEIAIILGSIVLIWKAIKSLTRLHLTNPSRL